MTDDQTRYPGTAPARSRLALTTHEISLAVDYPLTLRHRHGTLTEVLYNTSVYRDAGGKVLGAFATVRDVTNQNQAHREIAQQQATALDRLAELEQFQRLAVGRELMMIELKKEIESQITPPARRSRAKRPTLRVGPEITTT